MKQCFHYSETVNTLIGERRVGISKRHPEILPTLKRI